MNGKYVIFERGGLEYPVLFPDHFVQHSEVKSSFDKPVSAGMWGITSNGEIYTYGKSISLGIKCRPEDAALINKQLNG